MILALLLPTAALATPLDGADAGPGSEERHFAILISNNTGFAGTAPLRYVADDVRKVREVLRQQGGFAMTDIYEVPYASPAYLQARIKEVGYRIATQNARGVRTTLFVYYTGHADELQMQLGARGVPWGTFQSWLADAGADESIVVVDACASGGMVTEKGLSRVETPLPDIGAGFEDQDLVIITSSARNESSRESAELQGSLFTHFWAHGQWGDADADADGQVTVREAYRYAADWTTRWTSRRGYGDQNPQVRGRRLDTVVARLDGGAAGTLLLPGELPGEYTIYDARRNAVVIPAEVGPEGVRAALAPGAYAVVRHDLRGWWRADVSIEAEESLVVDASDFHRGDELDVLKGATLVTRRPPALDFSVHTLVGGQTFVDPVVRQSYFPSGPVAGLELRTRWPNGAYWSGDLWAFASQGEIEAAGVARTARAHAFGGGLGAGFVAPTHLFTLGGGLHVEAWSMTRSSPDGAFDASSVLIPAPGLAGFAGLRDGRVELELQARTHWLPYVLDPAHPDRLNVGTTQVLASAGVRF